MNETNASEATSARRRRRSNGERSRAAILEAAARLATVEGLDGLSIARLAGEVGMSKSGLFAHFGSKEELQLAAIETAEALYEEEVVAPALAQPTPLARLRALCERFLSHVERGVFPGGCFFASVAAELDTRPGPTRDRAAAMVTRWLRLLEATIREAQAEGAIDSTEDAGQLAFELNAMLLQANATFLIANRDRLPLERARVGIDRRLAAATTA